MKIYLKHKMLTVQNLFLFKVGKLEYRFSNNRLTKTFENYFTLILLLSIYKTLGVSADSFRLPLFPAHKLPQSIKFFIFFLVKPGVNC